MASFIESVRTPRDRKPIAIAFLVALSLAAVTDALAAWSDSSLSASDRPRQVTTMCTHI